MRLDDFMVRDTSAPLKRIDVLCEAQLQKIVCLEEFDEGVGRCRPEFTRVKLMCECVDCVQW
jgi:hypothetical protein